MIHSVGALCEAVWAWMSQQLFHLLCFWATSGMILAGFRPQDVAAHPLRFGNEANTGKTNLVGCCSTLQMLKGAVVLTL